MSRSSPHFARSKLAAALLAGVALSGCATFSPDGGFDPVRAIAQERLGQPLQRLDSEQEASRARDEVAKLLASPLTPDGAVRIALLNNRDLQAGFAELGIAEADLVQAGRLRNPGFTYGRFDQGSEQVIERTVLFDLLGLLTLPARTKIEARRFEQAQLRVADTVLGLAARTRQAYFGALAAEQSAAYREQVREAAAAGAELARRLAAAGNVDRLRYQREQLFYAEATADLARARAAALAAREALTRLLGLSGDEPLALPERLPDLPADPLEAAALEQRAMEQRLDIRLAKQASEALARNLGLNRATAFVNVLEVGYLNATSNEEPKQTGYEVELRLPLFDWGQARVAKAEALYTQALHRTAAIAVNARSEVRQGYGAYRTAYDLARHYRDEVVPLQRKIAEEDLLRYNGMLISPFELLADARAQVAGVDAAIAALRDFWLTESDLQLALNGSGAGLTRLAATRASAAAGATDDD